MADVEARGDPAAGLNFSPRLRRLLNLAALTITLLPIPVALLGILPVYRVHGRFLVFYAPFVCLLALAYVIYVRDSLARSMFAHLLDPPPAPDDAEPGSGRSRRVVSEGRRLILAALPGLLLLTSLVCIVGYNQLLADSIHTVSRADVARSLGPEEVGALSPAPSAPRDDGRAELWGRLPLRDRLGIPQRLLEVTPASEIPYFTELTLLYVGAFLAPLLAILLMGVREYAKDALGLTERDVVLGRLLVDAE